MKVINPFNRVPETEETVVHGGCHCVCSNSSQNSYYIAWLPIISCKCSCAGGDTNHEANRMDAHAVGHS